MSAISSPAMIQDVDTNIGMVDGDGRNEIDANEKL